jgi:glycosyltransferase involved in cell wall biosynthesis
VRIGIDMLAVQSPGSRLRGIGRLGHNLVSALLAHDDANQYVLYAFDGLPIDRVPVSNRAKVHMLGFEPGDFTLHNVIDRLASTNPHGLDALLVLSPMELYQSYAPPQKPLSGLTLAAVVHDVIPFLFQERYLGDLGFSIPLYRSLEWLKKYDVLLSNSDATRADFLRLLGLHENQVVTVSCATEGGFFAADKSEPMNEASRALLRGLGITRPFVFNLGGEDPLCDRKNMFGLIEAFSLLPEPLRFSHQLVLSCFMTEGFMARLRSHAALRGVERQLVLTNGVSDTTLRVLFQRCAVFAFPSFYEGFGLPLLEAMQCGAPVVAGNNSSQMEVAGDAGLFANAHDAADIAAKLARVLSDQPLAALLGERALEQARRFSWEKTAAKTVAALTEAAHRASAAPSLGIHPRTRKLRFDHPHSERPRIAMFSPFAPKGSGISDYAARLVHVLKPHYSIDLYHDVGYIPELALSSPEFACHDYRLFDRIASQVNYSAVLYQMGNSVYHRFVYQTLLRHPGIVTLHDFCLSNFQYWFTHLPDAAPGSFENEIRHNCRARAEEYIGQLADWSREFGGIQVACARRGLWLNKRVFELAERVVVHSPWCLRQVEALYPDLRPKAALVPMGASPRYLSAEQKAAIRARFDLPASALICGSFGILTKGKMNNETVETFAELSQAHPEALLLFVGDDWENGETKSHAERLGLQGHVRFMGRQPVADFADLIAITDIGIALRLPPTNGETSASLLDLLRSGVATIVTDVTTFSDYPDTVVRKVKWEQEGIAGLRQAIQELAADARRRSELGEAARRHVAEHHAWPHAAALYGALIEQCHAGKTGASSSPRDGAMEMHRHAKGSAPARSRQT